MMRFDTILQTCSNLFNTNMTKYLHFEKTADKMTYYYKAIPRTALFRINMIWIVTIHVILKHVWTCWNMSELVQILYDMNCYDSCDCQTCLNMLKHVWTCSDSIWYELLQFMWFSNMSEHVETCLNLLDSIWYKFLQFMWFSNMSEYVERCLNLFRFNMIWIVTIHVILKHVWTCWNMSKLVQIQYDMNCYDLYDSQTCLNILKHV